MFKFVTLMVLTAALAGCGGGGSSSGNAPTQTPPPVLGLIDVIHASSDAPAVNINAGTTRLFSGLDYAEAVSLRPAVGPVSVTVGGLLPDASTPTVIGPADLTVTEGDRLTVIALGDLASIQPLVLTQSISDIAAGQLQVRVVHAAPAAPMVDVYVSAPGTDISTEAPLGSFEFTGVLGPVTVPSGDYQLSVTLAGDPTTIVYQSEASLAAGLDVVVAAIPNTGVGPAPIQLLVAALNPANFNDQVQIGATLVDSATPTHLRVVHASPDAPAVDVVANDQFASPAVNALAYPDFTDYLSLSPGELNVKVVPAGSVAPVVIDADLTLVAGEAVTVLATNVLAEIGPLVLTDDLRRVTTEAKLRLVHGSPAAGSVDIYVVAPGADITDATPAFAEVLLNQDTGYVPLTPGDYDVIVTATGDKMPAIGPVTVSLAGGEIYTAVARDETGGGLPLGLILMDDFI